MIKCGLFREVGLKTVVMIKSYRTGKAQLDDVELGSKIIPIYLPITLIEVI